MPKRPAPSKPADWSPQQTHAALKKQQAALESLRDRDYRGAENEEREWKNLTLNILIHGFGEQSENVAQFHSARSAGEYYIGHMSPGLIQSNYGKRINAFAALLRSSIAELEMMLPQPEIAGSYDTGDEYTFYRDLKTIVGFGTRELFVVDAYLDIQLFDVYMENVSSSVSIRVLTNKVSDALKAVAEKFARRGGTFELRSSNDVHDRVLFADDRCFVIGQSIKDAAKKKPTYIVEHSGSRAMRSIYEAIWAAASTVVKS